MEILITDVTEMGGDNFCVAGWDTTNKRMVRPLPGGGNWPQALVGKHKIQPGTVLTAESTGSANGAFPDRTEDNPIDPASITTIQSSPNWVGADAPDVSTNVGDAFSNNLQWNKIFRGVHQGVYIPTNTPCGSLAAVRVDKSSINFVEP
jgi:hypothetical protein